jgi:HAD superfamily hydrolase (TIGR01509 family)
MGAGAILAANRQNLIQDPWFNMNATQLLCAVVFDLDGLIANTEDLYEQAGEELLGRRGKVYERELREQMMGRPVADSLRIMIEYHALTDGLDDLLLESQQVMDRLLTTSLSAMPGLFDLLDELRAGRVPAAVATSGTRSYADHVLRQLGILERFRFVLAAEDIRRGKPDPEVYLLAARRLQLAPAAMMVLEDSTNGCRAAVAAGAFTVAVPNRHTGRHDFSGARFVANTLADPRILRALRLTH